MSSQIVRPEEVLRSVGRGKHTAIGIAEDLAVSTSTVRRCANLLIECGWLTTQLTARQKGPRRITSVAYVLTDRGHEAFNSNEEM